jgi:hypothetical protein
VTPELELCDHSQAPRSSRSTSASIVLTHKRGTPVILEYGNYECPYSRARASGGVFARTVARPPCRGSTGARGTTSTPASVTSTVSSDCPPPVSEGLNAARARRGQHRLVTRHGEELASLVAGELAPMVEAPLAGEPGRLVPVHHTSKSFPSMHPRRSAASTTARPSSARCPGTRRARHPPPPRRSIARNPARTGPPRPQRSECTSAESFVVNGPARSSAAERFGAQALCLIRCHASPRALSIS